MAASKAVIRTSVRLPELISSVVVSTLVWGALGTYLGIEYYPGAWLNHFLEPMYRSDYWKGFWLVSGQFAAGGLGIGLVIGLASIGLSHSRVWVLLLWVMSGIVVGRFVGHWGFYNDLVPSSLSIVPGTVKFMATIQGWFQHDLMVRYTMMIGGIGGFVEGTVIVMISHSFHRRTGGALGSVSNVSNELYGPECTRVS